MRVPIVINVKTTRGHSTSISHIYTACESTDIPKLAELVKEMSRLTEAEASIEEYQYGRIE